MAKSKIGNKRKTIGFFVTFIDSLYHYKIYTAISDECQKNDINLIVFPGGILSYTNPEDHARNFIYEFAKPEIIDGLIMTSGDIANESKLSGFLEFMKKFSEIPCIHLSSAIEGQTSILLDNTSGIRALLNHLIQDHHYKRIAFIKGHEESYDSIERYNTYCEVLKENGIPLDPDLVVQGNFLESGGTNAVITLLDERKTEVDAIYAANDNMAWGAIKEFQARGIKVPDDIAVVGFDDIEYSSVIQPKLTTVLQPLHKIGVKAVESMIAIFNGTKLPDKIYIPTEPILRESCGCGPGNNRINYPSLIQNLKKEESADFSFYQSLRDKVLEDIGFYLKLNHFQPLHIVITLIEKFFQTLMDEETEHFLEWYRTILFKDLEKYSIEVQLQEVVQILSSYITSEIRDKNKLVLALLLIQDMLNGLINYERTDYLKKDIRAKYILTSFRGVAASSIATQNLESMLKVLDYTLNNADIDQFYCVLYENSDNAIYGENLLPLKSKLLMAYNNHQKNRDKSEVLVFPSLKLLPDEIIDQERAYCFVIEPLMYRSKQYGMALIEILENTDIQKFFMLRMVMLNAINSVIFTEQLGISYAILKEKNLQIEKLSFAVQNSASSIVITNPTGIIEYVNPKFLEFNGYKLEEVIHKNVNLLKSGKVSPNEYITLWSTIKSGKEWRGQLINRKKNGDLYWVLSVIFPLKDEFGKIINFVANQEDITEIKLEEENLMIQRNQLSELANIDGLTGINNRRYFFECGEKALLHSKLNKQPLFALMMDIDHFKKVNDTFGHINGDRVLQAVSKISAKALRDSDFLGRYGGEEFAILLVNIELENALKIAERVRTVIEQEQIAYKKDFISITISIGITGLKNSDADLKTLLNRADTALYRAKKNGRNRVEIAE